MKNIPILFVLICLCGCNEQPPLKTGLEGKPLPSFNLLLNDGVTYFNTGNIPAGKPVVLFYFSPECPYCRAQMTNIINDISSLQNVRFYVFTNYPFSELRSFYKHYQLQKYQNIVVGVDYANFFGDYFKIQVVPYTAIYSKDNKLNKAFIGNIPVKQIKEIVEN